MSPRDTANIAEKAKSTCANVPWDFLSNFFLLELLEISFFRSGVIFFSSFAVLS
jgi:hypothetical protein